MKDSLAVEGAIRSAWIWLVLVPVGSVLGQLAGHLIALAFGQAESGPLTMSWWQVVIVVIPTTLLTVVPAYMSARLGVRIKNSGRKLGWFFALVGGFICFASVAISFLTSFGVGQ
jgi:ABC-type glycerol-3-phosphate transport system permease component